MSETEDKKPVVKKKAAATKAAPEKEVVKQPEYIIFVSREKEPVQFHIRDRYSHRRPDGRLRWRFTPEEAKFVRNHHYVKAGRVVEDQDG